LANYNELQVKSGTREEIQDKQQFFEANVQYLQKVSGV
jgi:hypothetical protein